jgi:hypothetical protein
MEIHQKCCYLQSVRDKPHLQYTAQLINDERETETENSEYSTDQPSYEGSS